jgi:hypothetical protein
MPEHARCVVVVLHLRMTLDTWDTLYNEDKMNSAFPNSRDTKKKLLLSQEECFLSFLIYLPVLVIDSSLGQ